MIDELFQGFEEGPVVDKDESVADLDLLVEGSSLPRHGEDESGVGSMFLSRSSDQKQSITSAESLQ